MILNIKKFIKDRLKEKTTKIGMIAVGAYLSEKYLGIRIPIDEIWGADESVDISNGLFAVGLAMIGIPTPAYAGLFKLIKRG